MIKRKAIKFGNGWMNFQIMSIIQFYMTIYYLLMLNSNVILYAVKEKAQMTLGY